MTSPQPMGLRPEPGAEPDAPIGTNIARLPSGRTLDLQRSRWVGVLDVEEIDHCRAHGIELAYDCAQVGWVPAACADDSPQLAGGERVIDLAVYASPEQGAMRMLSTLSTQIERAGAVLPDPAAAAGAIGRLRDAIGPQIADCRTRHGVVAASRWHLAAQARLARAEVSRPAPEHTDEFSFRPWTTADAPRYRAMLDNPRLWHYLPETCPQPLTEATALALIELGSIDTRQQAYAVVRDGESVGQCLLRLHEPFAGMRTGEVAYWLAEEHWGKGWMSRILPSFVVLCFAKFEVEALEVWIRDDHAASARVAARSGFARDPFAFEAELAVALTKPRAQRYVAYRAVYAALRSRPATPSADVAGSR